MLSYAYNERRTVSASVCIDKPKQSKKHERKMEAVNVHLLCIQSVPMHPLVNEEVRALEDD